MASTAALDIAVKMTGADKASGDMDSLASSTGGLGTALGLAGAGVLAFGGFLVGAASAANEEQIGMDRLGGTLKDNIPGWKGNEDAVEGYVSKMEGMAFADDKIRDSLNSLIPRTHDLSEAQHLQAIAMDLARAKGLDLETATMLVGKVYSGNVGILGRYGIAVDKNATSTEALAAIQASSAGAAETYANSSAGSMDRLKTAMGDTFETIGHAVLNIVSGPMKQFADWFTSPAVQAAIQQVADTLGVILTGAIQTLSGVITAVMPTLMSIFQFLSDNAVPVGIVIASVILSQVVPAFIAWATTMLTTVLPAFIATMAPIIAAAAPFIALGLVVAGLWVAFQTNFLGIRDLVLQVWSVIQPIMQPFIDAFKKFFDTVGSGGDIMGAIGTLFGNLGAAISAAGPKILPALGEIGAMLWQWIQEAAPKVFDALGTLIGGILQWIGTNGPPILAQLGQWAVAFAQWVWNDAIPGLLSALGTLIAGLWQWIQDNGPGILAQLGTWAQAFGQWIINDALPWLFTNLGNLLGAIIQWIGDNGPGILAKLGEWAQAFGLWIINDALPWLFTNLGNLIGAIWTWISTNAPILLGKLGEWSQQFLNWIMTDLLPKIPGWLGNIASALWTWASQTAGDVVGHLVAVGKGILDGIMQGLGGAASAIGNFLMGIAKGIWNDIVAFFTGQATVAAADPGNQNPENNPPPSNQRGRAHGGTVQGGTPYMVGENGPEMFVPGRTGSIIPNGSLGGGGVSIGNVIIYAGLGTDGALVAQRFLDELEAELGTNVRIRHAGALA